MFSDNATTNYTYYAMALYDYSYGMTDRRKAEFKISLEIAATTSATNTTGTVIATHT